ncbi:MAG: ATP-binding protein [Ruminococcus sp.]|nr:ATP-binding protein [Ruminococcus sp.]
MKKRQTEIRKLDWSLFTKDNQLGNGVNKGIAFEDVVEQLIKAMFPKENWRRTPKSHDKKRDFVYPQDETLPDQKWAECKNYYENLSINTIAPTLVMGAIDQIQCIYFYSYSKLNDNAIEGILRYAESSKKKVNIFDGILLDNLIIKYNNQIETKRFFPNDDFSNLSYDNTVPFRLICSVTNTNNYKTMISPRFNIGAKFVLKVIVQNLMPNENNFSYKVEAPELKLSRSGYDGELKFGSIIEHKIICEGLKAGKWNISVKLNLNGTDISVNAHVEISDQTYSFWSGKNAVESYRVCTDHLTGYNEKPLFITGSSGMGKTTMLDLIANNEEVLKKYEIQCINHMLTREACLKELLFNRFGLESDNSVDSESQEKDKLNDLKVLLTNYTHGAGDLAKVLMNTYDPKKPFLFMVDNAHLLSSAYARWIKEIISVSKKQQKKVYVIFAIDPVIISIEDIYTDLYATDEYSDESVNDVHLRKFDKQDTIAYIQHFYGDLDIRKFFDNYTDQMVVPAKVQRFCSMISEKEVLIPLPDKNGIKYKIIDENAFAEFVEKYIYSDFVLDSTDPIFENKKNDECLKFIYISGSANLPQNASQNKIIHRMIEYGILARHNNNVFFSSSELRTIIGNILSFSDDDYDDLYEHESSSQETKALCILNLLKKKEGAYNFLDNFFKSQGNFITKNQRWETCCLVLDKFGELRDMGLIHQLLLFLKNNYTPLYEEQGHYKFFLFLELAMKTFISNNWDTDNESIEIIAYFIKKYFDRALSTYNYSTVGRNYDAIKAKFISLKHLPESRKNYWLCHFSNRAAIVADRASDVFWGGAYNDADTLYKESRKRCLDAGDPSELRMQILIDEFYRYYVYGHSLKGTILNSFYDDLRKLDTDELHEIISLQYHLILMEYMKLKLANTGADKLKELPENIISLRKKCNSPFYVIKLYLIEIYILIETEEYGQAYELLDEAKEYALTKDMRSWIYKLSCAKAFLMKICPSIEKEIDLQGQIRIAFEQFIRIRKNSIQDLKREIFLPVELSKMSEDATMRKIVECIKAQDKTQDFWGDLNDYISGNMTSNGIKYFRSYFTIHGIDFPNI